MTKLGKRYHLLPVRFISNPVITTQTLPNGRQGLAYSATLNANLGQPPYTWSYTGSLDPGLSLSSSTGVISGTPTTPNTYTITVTATDALGRHSTPVAFTIIISVSSSQAATPTFSPAAGTYTSAQTVTISCATPGATIYYTTNGTTPTTSSPMYSAPITVSSTETVQAIATASGYTQSSVGSATYTISSGSSINYPLTQVSPINTGSGIPFTSLIAKYNYILYQGGAYQTTDYHSGFQTVQSYAASYTNQNPANVCGFYDEDDEWWQSTSVSGAVDYVKINFGLGNSPGASPGGYLRSTPNGSFVNGADVSKYAADYSDLCPTFTVNTVGSLTGPSPTFGAVNWGQFCSWKEYNYWCAGNGGAMGLPSMPANPLVGLSIHDNSPPNNYSSLVGAAWGNSSSGQSLSLTQLRNHWEKGWVQSYAMLRALKSGILCGGNYTNYLSNGWVPQNTGIADIGLIENPTGYGLTYNTWAGFIANCIALEPLLIGSHPYRMIGSLEYAGPSTGSPPNQTNMFPNLQSSWTAIHYQGARIQAAINAGLGWISGMGQGNGTVYIDEWDEGTGNPGYLGPMTGSRTLSAGGGSYFQNTYTPFNTASTNAAIAGIATFPFANGFIYANLPTNGNVGQGSAVTLPSSALQNGGGHHITYTLAGSSRPPNVTGGAAFTSLYIQPYDAVFTVL